ncbi:unnamed protein product [Lactuca virosa]|uniref:Uncharacterized protein n=1 Tax=Lactuca virosa TaxID=75947 RepID=A0AAU9NTD4_9ASTR|nr:unnamed protein product [Lactuca virosa]
MVGGSMLLLLCGVRQLAQSRMVASTAFYFFHPLPYFGYGWFLLPPSLSTNVNAHGHPLSLPVSSSFHLMIGAVEESKGFITFSLTSGLKYHVSQLQLCKCSFLLMLMFKNNKINRGIYSYGLRILDWTTFKISYPFIHRNAKILIQVFDRSDLILMGCSPVKPLPFHLSSRNTFLLNHILPLCPPDPFMRVEPKHEEFNRVHQNALHWTDVYWLRMKSNLVFYL